MTAFTPTEYHLVCVASGEQFEDSGWTLDCTSCNRPSLIRTVYAKSRLSLDLSQSGVFKFRDWLPIKRLLKCNVGPITYRSKGLANALGLENLYITFNGYFPERGAKMGTCTFKDVEAYSVCARIEERCDKILVVASAGNTARAFAKVCSDNNIPLLLSVPEDNLSAMWFTEPLNDCVKLICCSKGGDYYDAIHLSDLVLSSPMFYAEGGAKNIARRDGMATTVLSAATTIGRIPDYYFQAIGSGTGAIAAWEANMRLIDDGRFGNNIMKLILSQNAPFLPMYKAWRAKSRELLPYDAHQARRDAEAIAAKVLSNRKPPYSIAGGLFDALQATDGNILMADNHQAAKAAKLFLECEGVDIHPAPSVALATLIAEVESGNIDPEATIMLNITGGGEQRATEGKQLWYLKPSLVFDLEPNEIEVIKKVEKLFM